MTKFNNLIAFTFLASTSGCEPINNFFDCPGMIDPPYVSGCLPGDKEGSVALWSKKSDDHIQP